VVPKEENIHDHDGEDHRSNIGKSNRNLGQAHHPLGKLYVTCEDRVKERCPSESTNRWWPPVEDRWFVGSSFARYLGPFVLGRGDGAPAMHMAAGRAA